MYCSKASILTDQEIEKAEFTDRKPDFQFCFLFYLLRDICAPVKKGEPQNMKSQHKKKY